MLYLNRQRESTTGREAGKDYIMERAIEIAEALRSADTLDMELACELCELAGMGEVFDAADGDTFEPVIYAAAETLGVEVI